VQRGRTVEVDDVDARLDRQIRKIDRLLRRSAPPACSRRTGTLPLHTSTPNLVNAPHFVPGQRVRLARAAAGQERPDLEFDEALQRSPVGVFVQLLGRGKQGDNSGLNRLTVAIFPSVATLRETFRPAVSAAGRRTLIMRPGSAASNFERVRHVCRRASLPKMSAEPVRMEGGGGWMAERGCAQRRGPNRERPLQYATPGRITLGWNEWPVRYFRSCRLVSLDRGASFHEAFDSDPFCLTTLRPGGPVPARRGRTYLGARRASSASSSEVSDEIPCLRSQSS